MLRCVCVCVCVGGGGGGGGGGWIVEGTAKIFTKQNSDRGVEILDSAPFDATHGLLPCYDRDLARSPETCVVNQPSGIGLGRRYFPSASGKHLTAPDRFPRADWQHKFQVTGLNPLSNAENISIWWRHHDFESRICTGMASEARTRVCSGFSQ